MYRFIPEQGVIWSKKTATCSEMKSFLNDDDYGFFEINNKTIYYTKHYHNLGNNQEYKTLYGNLIEYTEDEGIKHDKEKLMYHLIPAECIEELAKVYNFGCKQYGEDNWKRLNDPMTRYLDALERHLIEWKKKNYNDDETGLSHMAHIAWNAFSLMWFQKFYKE